VQSINDVVQKDVKTQVKDLLTIELQGSEGIKKVQTDIFLTYDRNQDGNLDHQEFKTVAQHLGYPESEQSKMFNFYKNTSDQITQERFVDFLEKHISDTENSINN